MDKMGVLDKLRKLLGLVEEHEDEVAKQVSKRTSVSEEQAKKGLDKAQEVASQGSNGNGGDRNQN